MYNYRIGHDDGEAVNYASLIHDEFFTEDEITQMVAEAIMSIVKNDNYTLLSRNLGCMWDGVVDWLIKERQFRVVKIDLEWSASSLGSVFTLVGRYDLLHNDVDLTRILNINGFNDDTVHEKDFGNKFK